MIKKQIVHTLIYNIVFIVSRFLLFFVLARKLLPAEYGVYGMISSIVTIGLYLFGMEFYNYAWREIPGKSKEEGLEILKSNLLIEVIFMFVLIVPFVFFGLSTVIWERLHFGAYGVLLNLAFVLLFIDIIYMEFKRYLIITKRIELSNYARFIGELLWIYPLALLFFVQNMHSLWIFLLFWICGMLLAVLFQLYFIGPLDFFRSRIDFRIVFAKTLPFSLPLVVPALSFYLMQLSNRYFLAFYKTPEAVGIFSFMFMIINTLYLIGATIFTGVLPPYIIEAHNLNQIEKRNILLQKLFRYPFMLVALFSILLLVNARDILLILARKEYISGLNLLYFLVLYPVIVIFINPGQRLLFLHKKTHLISLSYSIGLLLYFILNIVLIPNFSYYGAAIAMISSFLLTCGFIYYFAAKEDAFSLFNIKLANVLILVLFCYAFGKIIAINLYFIEGIKRIFISSGITSICFIGLMIVGDFLDVQELRTIMSLPYKYIKKRINDKFVL